MSQNPSVVTIFKNNLATGTPSPRNQVIPPWVRLTHGNSPDSWVTFVNATACNAELRFPAPLFDGLSTGFDAGGTAFYFVRIAAGTYVELHAAQKNNTFFGDKYQIVFDATQTGCATVPPIGSLGTVDQYVTPGDDPHVIIG